MDQWIHCLSLVERCRLWCSKDIIRSGIGDSSIIVSVWNYEPYKQHGDMSFEIEGTHTTKTMIWVCRIKTLGFARKNCNLNGTWWNSGYPSFFRLHFVFLSSSSSFSSLPFPLFPFLCVPLSFREVPISWGPGSQKTKNEANIPFHQFSFEFTVIQNFYRIESFIYSHWQRLCTLLQKCPDDNSSGLNSIWFEPAWVRLKKLVQKGVGLCQSHHGRPWLTRCA